MPDLTSRKSETDADRRRNEHQFAALAKGLANVENMGERERERAIFDQIAASRPTSKGPRHRAASDIFADPINDPARFEPMRKLGEHMSRERDEKICRDLFGVETDIWGTNARASTVVDDEVWLYGIYPTAANRPADPPKPPADQVIDAPFRVLEGASKNAHELPGNLPALAQAPIDRRDFYNPVPLRSDMNPGIDPTA